MHVFVFVLDACIQLLVRAAVLGNAHVLSHRESQNQGEQPVQQNQADRERDALSKGRGQLVVGDAGECEGQEHKQRADNRAGEKPGENREHHRDQEHPAVAPGDFAQQVGVVKRDKAPPPRLAGFFEDLPVADDRQNQKDQNHGQKKQDDAKVHAEHGCQHLRGIRRILHNSLLSINPMSRKRPLLGVLSDRDA